VHSMPHIVNSLQHRMDRTLTCPRVLHRRRVSTGAEERSFTVECNTKIEADGRPSSGNGRFTASTLSVRKGQEDLCGIGLSFKSKGGLQRVFGIKEGSMCAKLDIQEGDTLVQVRVAKLIWVTRVDCPYTLRPAPCTLHSMPHTLHPTPKT
jgi:hypothetical protein